MKQLFCDVLVVGGGESGIRAAVEARLSGAEKVILVNKGPFGSTGVMFSELTYGWDMQVASGENDPTDSRQQHLEDVMNASQGTASRKLAEIVVDECADRLQDLQELFGLELAKWDDGSGKNRQVYGCFSSKNRAYQFVNPGRIKKAMLESLVKYEVSLVENVMITRLLVSGGKCLGAEGIGKDKEIYIFTSAAVILATGGATGIYQHNFAAGGMYGDGYPLALQAGCTLANMEFMQFGLGVLQPRYRALFLDRLMFLGPRFEFKQNHNFTRPLDELMALHSKHFPFSCIDDSYALDIAIFHETLANNGSGVTVDISHIPMEELQKIPVYKLWSGWFGNDFDPHCTPLQVTTFAHACNGGVMINENARTSVEGLYSAGEMISGPHGANRPGGNMHSACQVYAARAGKAAASYAAVSHTESVNELVYFPAGESGKLQHLASFKEQLGKLLWENVNVERDEAGLRFAHDRAGALRRKLMETEPALDEYWEYCEALNSALTAEVISGAALQRDESRGSHYRRDYPHTALKPYIVRCCYSGEKMQFARTSGFDI